MSDFAFFTPTCARDLPHFALLRASLRRFAPAATHIAAVQTEDLAAFAEYRKDPGLVLMSTAELLPSDIEAQRRKRAARPMRINRLERSLQKRLGWFPKATQDGWHCQQLTKFAAVLQLPYEGLVLVDSDALLTQPFSFDDLSVGGKLPVYATWQAGHKPDHWTVAAHQLLGLPQPEGGRYWYVSQPYLFLRDTVRALCDHLEARQGLPWQQALLGLHPGDLSEFTIYGLFAQRLHADARCVVTPGDVHSRWVFSPEHRAQLPQLLRQAFDPVSGIRFLIIQSDRHHPVSRWQGEVLAAMAQAP